MRECYVWKKQYFPHRYEEIYLTENLEGRKKYYVNLNVIPSKF